MFEIWPTLGKKNKLKEENEDEDSEEDDDEEEEEEEEDDDEEDDFDLDESDNDEVIDFGDDVEDFDGELDLEEIAISKTKYNNKKVSKISEIFPFFVLIFFGTLSPGFFFIYLRRIDFFVISIILFAVYNTLFLIIILLPLYCT